MPTENVFEAKSMHYTPPYSSAYQKAMDYVFGNQQGEALIFALTIAVFCAYVACLWLIGILL